MQGCQLHQLDLDLVLSTYQFPPHLAAADLHVSIT